MNWFDLFANSTNMQAYEIAAEAERQLHEEEEDMTPYSGVDLTENWEFKILRSATNAFKNPEKLREILNEEAKAGWTLVEKFDDGRIRLKRAASAKRDDRTLGFDPYRTQIGLSGKAIIGFMAVCVIAAIIIAGVTMIAFLKG
jgi:hypothetical protein